MPPSSKPLANIYGYGAILLWSFAAMFVSNTPQLPPFFLTGIASGAGFVWFLILWIRNPSRLRRALRQPWPVWGVFFLALVAYRGFYFAALKTAPVVEANLINYLWPLLIVLMTALFIRKKLSWPILAGAALCFAGVLCIGLSKKTDALTFHAGHLIALAGALTWSSYSLLTRRYANAPIDMVGIMLLIATILLLALHTMFENPASLRHLPPAAWVAITMLSITPPLGTSLWDYGMKNGDHEIIAVAAYFTPLLSTLWLILFGHAAMTPLLWLAAILILGGSLVARFGAKPLAEKPVT